jgi:hypothetical protein
MTEPVTNIESPAWAREPVQRLLSNVRQIHEFYHLTIDGLRMIINHHEFLARADERIQQLTVEVESYGETVDRNEAEEAKREKVRKHAKERADLALREVSNGFPVLHRQQVVFLWGAIEAVVEDTLVAWLKNENLAGKDQRLRKIKVSLADFSAMNESERNYHLVSELRREVKSGHRSSIEVFELILHMFGLQGAMDPQLKRSLIELEYVRNVLLHRRGTADSRFIEGCPWTTVKIGTFITPNEADVDKYTNAVLNYAELLLGRIRGHFESKPAESDAQSRP